MGKGVSPYSGSHSLRSLHSVARQRRDDFWSPPVRAKSGSQPAKSGAQPDNTTTHLINAGFIQQSNAGVYHFLPLGLRVLEKVERLLDKHMSSIGASKVALSSLSNQSLWRKSGRLDAGGELFKFTDRSKTAWLLAPTHEEEITAVVKQVGAFPQQTIPGGQRFHGPRLYQVGRKYRDEIRPRGGLLRGKEFIMKDLYTFDKTPEDARATYDEIRAAYRRFFDELGLPYTEARADSGNMGGNLSHEYHFPSQQGEDTIITCSSCDHARNVEFVDSIERTIRRLPQAPPDLSSDMGIFAPISRDFISEDKSTLVRALVPAEDASGTTDKSVKSLVNTHIVKAALKGIVDVATGIEEDAARKLFFTQAKADAEPKQRSIYYVLDKRLGAGHLVMQLQQNHNTEDVELWAVRSTARDPLLPSAIDLLLPQDGDPCPSCSVGRLKVNNAVEIGHTFHLGTRYSEKFDFTTDRVVSTSAGNHEEVRDFVEMGCHGIGVSRLIAAAALPYLAGNKPPFWRLRWPKVIAPYQVVIIRAWDPRHDDQHGEHANQLYDALEGSGRFEERLDVLMDDRNKVTTGYKIADAFCIGVPVLAIVRKDGTCTVMSSEGQKGQDVELAEAPVLIRDLLSKL